ncbi:pikE, partial [Symbiodinium necroappetens]
VRQRLLEALRSSQEAKATRHLLEQQERLRKKLLWSLQVAKGKRDRIEKKIERFRQALVATDPPAGEDSFQELDLVNGLKEGIPLPVDPSVSLVGILPEQCFLLKSAMNPGVLACQVRPSSNPQGQRSLKRVMVKEGDDLRQDQLVLQLIILMDSILKRYGLDLQLTPYQVIALSRNDGLIDFVPDSSNLSKVLKEHNGDIQQFFRAHHPADAGVHKGQNKGDDASGAWCPQNSYGIKAEVLENFVRSCAGYCVITYILGIGDRHLDNLMVTKDGKLFHIDFGFILGKDPKPFPPPMRICKEMVEGMGGNPSPGYQSFKSKCCGEP